jgi:hypothetical protein
MSIDMVTCPSCGNEVPGNSRFCPECGYNLASYVQATGQLPPLSPGTLTLNLGSLSSEQQAQVTAVSQSPQSEAPQQPAQSDQGAWTQPASQPQQQNTSLVPVGQDALAIPPPPLYRDSQMLQPTELNPAGPLQIYPTFSQPATTYGSYQVQVDDEPAKNPLIGFLLELMGLFGFLGVGHMYSGHVPRGIVLMLTWFVYSIVFLLVIIFANVASFFTSCLGIGNLNCLIYPFLAVFIIVPILSGFAVHNKLDTEVRRRAPR